MGIPALPFSKRVVTVQKPLGEKYIFNPSTLGEKLRNRRLELHLLQKDVATMIGVTEDSITNWENSLSDPEIRYMPSIITFLGYIPYDTDLCSFAGKINYCRIVKGLTHKQLGALLFVDGSTIGSWLKNEHIPHMKKRTELSMLLTRLIEKDEILA